jgi:uncharacterized protein (TIGR00156 family)
MYAGHKVQQENSQSRIQIVSSMHEGAWITLEGNVVSQQQDSGIVHDNRYHQSPHPQKVWNGQHFDAQDLVQVSGPVSHENDGSILYVAVISKPKTQF